ncbi:MAG TPA: S9 family peptidase [Pyrinomonadaceae bacterium]|jgi:dipeptidyl aminopeptidase/acylaminoacyl peptidase|nr:S9 family peptidase [Pyrinomonadaceae bacterium]
MPEIKIAPYGSWKSPITADLIVQGAVGLGMIKTDGEDVYWLELRPSEGGRTCIVRRTPDGELRDMTPPPFNARTRVHEYGGGDFVVHEGAIYFSNFSDQRLYRQTPDAPDAPAPLTPESNAELRYADAIMDAARRRLIAVREDHRAAGAHEPANTLVALSLDAGENADGGRVLVSGYDFYSSPRLSPDGRQLAWLCWNHPNMPWDGTELWLGDVAEDGSITGARRMAGGRDESIFQPEWSPAGRLHFVSDRSGWWNLYRAGEDAGEPFEPLCEIEAEFGQPQWGFGMSTYAFASETEIVCAYIVRGLSQLARLDTTDKKLRPVESIYADLQYVQVAGGRAVLRAGAPQRSAAIVGLDLASGQFEVLRRANEHDLDEGYLSIAQPIEFPTTGGQTAHAFYYPPRNRDFAAPDGERPPLLVKIHGGPTAMASTTLSLNIQFWTSRGIAVLDVNYGGSTGYGRRYRLRLNGTWGITDVDDCANGARHLAAEGLVDGARCVITGGSAGGYTTLAALTFRDTFKAGASHYGVSDLGALVRDTHKFESRYLDNLVGPYPERADLYHARSPINFTDQLSCPVIFFQGLEDKVVPPNQAELMVEALRSKGLPVAYVAFEGEQHGFRRAENIKRALEGELYFYSRVFGFELADPVEPIPLENL